MTLTEKILARAAVLIGGGFLIMSGCANNDLRFAFEQGAWQARIKKPGMPFATDTIRIEVANELNSAPPPTPDQIALIHRVIDSLPELMPVITKALGEYDEEMKDPKTFREQLMDPALCLFTVRSASEPPGSWSFTVERPSLGHAFGYHLEFVEQKFTRIWAGD